MSVWLSFVALYELQIFCKIKVLFDNNLSTIAAIVVVVVVAAAAAAADGDDDYGDDDDYERDSDDDKDGDSHMPIIIIMTVMVMVMVMMLTSTPLTRVTMMVKMMLNDFTGSHGDSVHIETTERSQVFI